MTKKVEMRRRMKTMKKVKMRRMKGTKKVKMRRMKGTKEVKMRRRIKATKKVKMRKRIRTTKEPKTRRMVWSAMGLTPMVVTCRMYSGMGCHVMRKGMMAPKWMQALPQLTKVLSSPASTIQLQVQLQ